MTDDDSFSLIPRIVNGSLAGIIGIAAIYPLDLVKTRLQTQFVGPYGIKQYYSLFDAFNKILRREGFLKMYNGLAINLILTGPETGCYLAANDLFRYLLHSPHQSLTLWKQIVAASFAGAFQSILTTPMEFLKIQMQNAGRLELMAPKLCPNKKTAFSTLKLIKKVYKKHGCVGFYRGAITCAYREISFSVIYFPLFSYCDMIGPKSYDGEPVFYWNFTSGVVSGAVGAFITTPLDVLKTRMQAIQPLAKHTIKISDCIRNIWVREGPLVFFKGGFCRVITIAPLYGIAQAVYHIGVAEYLLALLWKTIQPDKEAREMAAQQHWVNVTAFCFYGVVLLQGLNMETSEKTALLSDTSEKRRNFVSGLSVLFAVICIVDVFGVFPIVALPKSIIDCGYYGLLVVLLVGSTQIYTATLLGRCWLIAEKIDINLESKNRYPFSALAELTFGHRFARIVTVFLDLTIFSGGIPNLIVASQTLQLLGRRVSENSFDLSFCFWIIIIGILMCPLLWLGSPKDMKLLCTFSVVMVILVFISVVGAMIFDTRTRPNNEPDFESIQSKSIWMNLLSAYGIITFQFDIHPTILTIQVDMIEKTKIGRAVFGGFIGSLTMFVVTTLVAYWRYGTDTKSSLLGSLPTGMALHFAALLVALQLGLTLAVSNSALYQHMEDCLGISRAFNHRRCILRTALTILAVLLAEVVPRFDLVMALIGGSFIGPLAFILPPIFHLKIKQLKRQHDEQVQLAVFNKVVYDAELPEKVSTYLQAEIANDDNVEIYGKCSIVETGFSLVIVVLATCFTIGTTYLNVFNIIRYASFSQPCLYNLTFVSPL